MERERGGGNLFLQGGTKDNGKLILLRTGPAAGVLGGARTKLLANSEDRDITRSDSNLIRERGKRGSTTIGGMKGGSARRCNFLACSTRAEER